MNVMITGAAGGLGRVMANECGRRGYDMYLIDVNADGLLLIKNGIERQFGVNVITRTCDLTNPLSVDEMMEEIDSKGITFDMLLNIAGMELEGAFMEREREKLVKIVTLNIAATLRITHAVIERRTEGGHFTAVFVSSLASMFPMPLKATYAASKRFLLDFATSLRQELIDHDANVLVLCPGGMVTKDETIEKIAVQGFWGNVTTNPLEVVARKTIDRALNGKAIYVPGSLNRVLSFIGKIVPRQVVASVIHWRWKHARQKACV